MEFLEKLINNYTLVSFLVIAAIIFSAICSLRVKTVFNKYNRTETSAGIRACDAARQILDANGLYDVQITRIPGNLTDYYDPKHNLIGLSQSVYESTSVGAIGVAAHECGHAIQYARDYSPIKLRNSIYPVVSLCSKTWLWLFAIGCAIGAFVMTEIAILFFAVIVLFQLITLPVEFDASGAGDQDPRGHGASLRRGAKRCAEGSRRGGNDLRRGVARFAHAAFAASFKIPPQKLMANARKTALALLSRVEQGGAYSNLALDRAFSEGSLSAREKAFAAALFYGVLERKMTLDYLIRAYSRLEFDRLDPSAVLLLRMGLYQLLYMESVPDRAAVSETVALCEPRHKGFVNAVLRAFLRDGGELRLDPLTGEARLSVEYSCPKWLVKMWTRRFGEEQALSLLKASLGRPPLFIKVNTLRTSRDEVLAALEKDGIDARETPLLPDCAEVGRVSGTRIEQSAAYRKGLFHVQDISSQLCCALVDPKPGETVLDLCAAPGGKSFTLAEKMENQGQLFSFDLHAGKLPLITEGAKRLGLSIISVAENDASVYNEGIPPADRVLCDAVCSGLGVIRRKPEIKYKPKAALENFPPLQRAILETAKRYVKRGGVLVYSTCTLNEAENEGVVEGFLRENADFTPVTEKNFFPTQTGGDGFFAAVFRRKL